MTGTDKGREKQGRPLECQTKCDHCHLRATTHGIRGKTAVSQLKRRRKVFEQAENPGERDGNPAQRGQTENRKRDGRHEHVHAHVRLNQPKHEIKGAVGTEFPNAAQGRAGGKESASQTGQRLVKSERTQTTAARARTVRE